MPVPKPLRIGIVGASAERSWAKDSHIPAIAEIPGVTLTAVATRSEASARAAAEAFGARYWFDDAKELVRSDAVDIVSICVKVPEHRAVVMAALEAGKHVYCEWPLGHDVAEAEMMEAAARHAGVHHAIGLQGHMHPAVEQAANAIESGKLGRLLSARIISTTSGYAPALSSAYAYLNDARNGANLTTILGGHTLDLACHLLGNILELDAMAAIRFPQITLTDTGGTIDRNTPDHLLVLSRHTDDCLLTTEIGGNCPPDTPFTFEIIGSTGRMTLRGGHPHGFQAGVLAVESDVALERIRAPIATGGLRGAAVNVAEVYAAFARDIAEDTRTVADFTDALRLTRLMAHVTQAANTGVRYVPNI